MTSVWTAKKAMEISDASASVIEDGEYNYLAEKAKDHIESATLQGSYSVVIDGLSYRKNKSFIKTMRKLGYFVSSYVLDWNTARTYDISWGSPLHQFRRLWK